jgi:carboxyl-terminal processing protease
MAGVALAVALACVGSWFTFAPPVAAARAETDDAETKARWTGLRALAAGRVTGRTLHLIALRYVDPQRIEPVAMLVDALQAVSHLVPEMLVDAPARDAVGRAREMRVRVAEATMRIAAHEVDSLHRLDWALLAVLRFVARNLPPDVAPEGLPYAAVNGALKSLDPFSRMLDPDAWRDMLTVTGGNFGGLGIVIAAQEGRLTVQSVIAGSPAERAGLLAGDQILQIDGEDTLNIQVDAAVDRLRGAVGSHALLRIRRVGLAAPRDLSVVRAVIHLQSVESKVLDNGVAYARLKGFQRGTADELAHAVEQMQRAGAQGGLVIDLRDNPGGLLDEAVRVCDLFLPAGPAVTTVSGGQKRRDVRRVSGHGPWQRLPLAVLLSAHSASASEVVAGALQATKRALVIGEQSYGKGSVQVPFPIEGGALKLTVAKYLVPGDVSIHGIGITPDVGIQFVSATREQVSLFGASRFGRKKTSALFGRGDQGPPQVPRVLLRVLLPDAWSRPDAAAETPAEVMEREPRQRAAVLLRRAGDVQASTFAVNAAPELAEMQRRDDMALIAHLKRQGIDWTPATRRQEPTLRLAIAEGGGGLAATAGQVLRFSVTVSNDGPLPLHRVHVLTACDDATFDAHEQLVGHLDPGEARTVHLRVRVPSRHNDVRLPLRVEAALDGQLAGRSVTALLTVVGKPVPEFAVRVAIDDSSAAGPGDGVLQPGEAARLAVELHNRGAGAATALVASLRVPGRPRLHVQDGRVKLGPLAADGKALATFAIAGSDVRSEPTVDAGEPVRVEVTLEDELLAVSRTVPVDLAWSRWPLDRLPPVARARAQAALRATALWDAPPRIQLLDVAGEPTTGPVGPVSGTCALDLPGLALFHTSFHTSSGGRSFVTASVGGVKQSYHAGRGRAEVPFRARLRLDSGLNTVTIQAQAGQRQIAQRNLLVYCWPRP